VPVSDPWVVWSFEHDAWWKPGGWGYTPALDEAGHFTELEALRIEHHANFPLRVIHEQAMPLTDALGQARPGGEQMHDAEQQHRDPERRLADRRGDGD
jgi:hypothetical protein